MRLEKKINRPKKINLGLRTTSSLIYVGIGFIAVAFLNMAYVGCGKGFRPGDQSAGSHGPASIDPQKTPDPEKPVEPIVAGNGGLYSGTGALSGPTADGVVARIQNGLQNNVASTAGNFAAALKLVYNNLPKSSDPTKATGFDQLQLLVYAACSDLTTGTTPLMQSKYSIIPRDSIPNNKPALIAAGKKMLEQYTAGLSSQGSIGSDVEQNLGSLVDQIAAETGSTTKMAFMGICIAANTAGTSMVGF